VETVNDTPRPTARTTRPRSKPWTLRLERRDRELLFLAAAREEITQSQFMRLAVRDRAARVLGETRS